MLGGAGGILAFDNMGGGLRQGLRRDGGLGGTGSVLEYLAADRAGVILVITGLKAGRSLGSGLGQGVSAQVAVLGGADVALGLMQAVGLIGAGAAVLGRIISLFGAASGQALVVVVGVVAGPLGIKVVLTQFAVRSAADFALGLLLAGSRSAVMGSLAEVFAAASANLPMLSVIVSPRACLDMTQSGIGNGEGLGTLSAASGAGLEVHSVSFAASRGLLILRSYLLSSIAVAQGGTILEGLGGACLTTGAGACNTQRGRRSQQRTSDTWPLQLPE